MVSVRYRLLNGPSVPLSALAPTLLLLNLNTGMDSGGALVVNLLLNKVSRLMGGGGVPWAGFVCAPACSAGCRYHWDYFSFLLLQNTPSLF